MATDQNEPMSYPYEALDVAQAPEPPEYKRHHIFSPSEWLLETATSILALGLLIGIAYIFWYMDNKPLSAWRGPVSLSASISVLTTTCATALMHGASTFIGQLKWRHFRKSPQKLSHLETFDEASRGVWGSILLLTTVKWDIATIGAVITILRLAFSPFAQQVILIEQRDTITADDTVTFGYTHNYSRNFDGELANTRVEAFPQDPSLQSAIVQGLYGIISPAIFTCPSTCRWTGSYITLGFKSSCRNVTEATLRSADCTFDSRLHNSTCVMTTPGGVGVVTRYWYTDLATSYYMNATSLLDNKSGVQYSVLPDTFPELTRFAIYRATPDDNFNATNINVTQCSLFLTAYEYVDANANGQEFTFGRVRELNFEDKNPWAPDGSVDYPQYKTNQTQFGDKLVPELGTNHPTLIALENFFESSAIVTEWVKGNYVNKNSGLAAALAGDVDIPARFEQMAGAMTDYLRSTGPNALLAHGDRVESVPFVSCRWPYFIVPVLTEALAFLFAALTCLSNRGSKRIPLWKSSTLAVLACHYDDQVGVLRGSSEDVEELETAAEKVKVQLL
ncbi:DUF3176 domain-containing protein [Aspergillus mulundensis]|uniref:Uncharacterized protein n=1 Tax=Aspergillus mulundensis TaxID=1810919 RepID=A0A3D8SL33_9EURO|nr:Uncharacterized protein DSM5745_03681 [Aspergillus mulundensis]RDW87039.1 Uncharacterized protein DSM5745_03681 [Aspergillus mulundensis]